MKLIFNKIFRFVTQMFRALSPLFLASIAVHIGYIQNSTPFFNYGDIFLFTAAILQVHLVGQTDDWKKDIAKWKKAYTELNKSVERFLDKQKK